jgi:peptidoglycan/LPS O-acetylase OafA/YrhL
MADPGTRRFQELDAFRGIAAAWVVLFHFVMRYQHTDMPFVVQERWVHALAGTVLGWLPDIGTIPVAWFFIISGFVMTWTLERARTWRDFAASRVARLYPVYWAAIAAIVIEQVWLPLPETGFTLVQCLVNLTMLQEILGVPHVSGVFWSLTIELVFYIGMAVLLRLGLLGHLHAICAAWVLACIANRLLAFGGIEVPWRVQKYGLLIYGPFLAAGIMYYHLWKGHRPRTSMALIALCLLSVVLASTPLSAVVYALIFATMWLAVQGQLRFLTNRPLLWLGSISYALYVAHEGVGFRLMYELEVRGAPRPVSITAAILASLLLADLLTRLVDPPARRRLRAWLTPAATPAPTPGR